MGSKVPLKEGKSKLLVHLLVIIFGITSWSILNGLWVELPILVSHLPEGWTLPSYLTIITQFGNIGLIVFSLLAYCRPQTKLETPASVVIVTALTLCALLYSLFWQETTYVAGADRSWLKLTIADWNELTNVFLSVALLGLTLSQAVFAATTSIAYVTFMAHLKTCYIASVFIGMGFSGLIPAFAAFGQGTTNIRCVHSSNISIASFNRTYGIISSDNMSSVFSLDDSLGQYNNTRYDLTDKVMAVNVEPSFSVQGFFLLLHGIGLVSLLCLLLLIFHPYCKAEHADTDKEENCQLMQAHSNPENTEQPSTFSQKQNVPSIVLNVNEDNKSTGGINNSFGEMKDPQTIIVCTKYRTSKIQPEKVSSTSSNDFIVSSPIMNQILQQPKEKQKTYSIKDDPNDKRLTEDVNKTYDSNNLTSHKVTGRNNNERRGSNQGRQITQLESWYLLGLLVWINALQTSFVLAIQVYSSLPYGIQFYHGATKVENIVDPIASFLTFWVVAKTTRVISILTFLGTLFIAYIITVAAMSPEPFLVNETAGGVLVIAAWVMCTLLMVFSKVSIAIIMRSQGRLSLMWTGGSTQLGASLGAIAAYIVINVLHLFKDEPWCR